MFTPVLPYVMPDSSILYDDAMREQLIMEEARQQQGASKRLTAKQWQKNNELPDATDHDNALAVYQFIMRLPVNATVAFDTETSYNPAIKSILASQTDIRFVQFAHQGECIASRVTKQNKHIISYAVAMLLGDRHKHVIMHNASFDLSIADRFLNIPHHTVKAQITDTLLLSQFVYLGNGPQFKHDLGRVLRRELGITLDKSAQASDWRLPVGPDRWAYINHDVAYLEALAAKLFARLDAESPMLRLGWEREQRYAVGPATAMTINGFRVDRNLLASDLSMTLDTINEKATKLTSIVGSYSTYTVEREAIEASIHKYTAQIEKSGKRKPGVAEKNLEAARIKLAALSPHFKYGSSKEKLLLLERIHPLLLRCYFNQASSVIKSVDADFDLDALFYTILADELESNKDAEESQEISTDTLLSVVQMTLDSYKTAYINLQQEVRNPHNTLLSVAQNFARSNAAARCSKTTATNWKLIKVLLTLEKANLSPEELPWLEAVDLFLELAKLTKKASMLQAYLTLADIDPNNPRLRSAYRTLGAATSRQSSNGPNLQNVDRGKAMRRMFIGTPGYRLAVFDASQIELRVAFALANEVKGLQAFKDGKDLHTVTALLIWGQVFRETLVERGVTMPDAFDRDPDLLYKLSYFYFDDDSKLNADEEAIKAILKPYRQLAKSANFGLLYGAGWRGLQAYIFASSGQTVTEAEARELRDKFFAAYPSLAAWHKALSIAIDRAPAALAISEDTRRLMPPEMNYGRLELNRNLKLTVAANTPVQGLSAVILKQATLAVYDKIQADPRYKGIRLVVSVHDELVLEIPEAGATDMLAADIRLTMYEASQHPLLGGQVEIKYAGGLCDRTNTWADK